MRNIFKPRIIGQLEQGSIINFCRASEYVHKEVFGIIITPRCDLSHSKVSTIHYLPIVSFSDWICVDYWNIFSQRVMTEIRQKIRSLLEKNKLSYNLFEMFSKDVLLNTIKGLIAKQADFNEMCALIDKYNKLSTENIDSFSPFKKQIMKEYPKISQNIFKELKENRFKEFYLLESWEDDRSYKVILTREIGTITIDFAQKIAKGVIGADIQNSDLRYCSIESINTDSFLCTLMTLQSPFIEHLIQHFFLNFGRIGIEDHRRTLESELHDFLIN